MEENEMLEQTNDTENTDTLSAEQKVGQENAEPVEFTEGEKPEVEEEKEATFTQSELEKIVKDRVFRHEQKIRDEYEQKYGRLETVMNAGLQTNSVEEITQKMTDFYKEQGVNIPETKLTARQEQILASAEAEDIINDGYEEVVKNVDRLANKGFDNMTAKEKLIFTKLAEERTRQESVKELASIGVDKKVLEDKEFIEFSNKLNPKLSAKEKYEMYEKMKPKKEIETIGSMKSGSSKDNGVKEFYSFEEAKKFTREDYMKNPKLMDIVEKSASQWK